MRSIWLIPLLAACHHRAPAPAAPPPSNTVAAPACPDEVTCAVMADPPACCPRAEMGPDPVPEEIPEERDREVILAGVAQVKERAQACGQQFPQVSGVVTVEVTVAPEGAVTGVIVKQAPDAALGACVAAAMQPARFARAQQPTVFGYPFQF